MGLAGWLRPYIPYYAQIPAPLQLHKTGLLRQTPRWNSSEQTKSARKTYARDTRPEEEMAFTSLQHLYDAIFLAFNGRRRVENTIVLDIRPFRSNKIRMPQDEEECIKDDAHAYVAFEEVLAL